LRFRVPELDVLFTSTAATVIQGKRSRVLLVTPLAKNKFSINFKKISKVKKATGGLDRIIHAENGLQNLM
jgi:hypothetical protein